MEIKICVVGLGYVGLPLAVELNKHFFVSGFDVNEKRINELNQNTDSSNEVDSEELKNSTIKFSNNSSVIKESNFIIVCVPTPIDKTKKPDLSLLESASRIVASNLTKGSIIVYESTVYPGVTEEICVPILEKNSGLKYGVDFKVGYSPERMNPGDKEHTINKIVKIVSGMDKESLEIIDSVYSKITKTYQADNIKVAEAAKVIENIQRDLNIALVNELSIIFNKMNIDTKSVLEAASTKWNFHHYRPGLVGGHCIGVDPYYLTHKALELGYNPEVILAGRKINDNMHNHVVDLIIRGLNESGKVLRESKVVLFGLSFKENVKDYRNSKAKDVIEELKSYGITVYGCDPLLDPKTVSKVFGVENKSVHELTGIDCSAFISPHDHFFGLDLNSLKEKMNPSPLIIDLKHFLNKEEVISNGFNYKSF